MVNLITLDEYKLAKSITKADQDQVLEGLITNVSAIIQKYIRRNLISVGPITEVFSLDYNSPYIYLEAYPINTVTSITAIDETYYDSTVHFAQSPTTYVVDYAKGRILRKGTCGWPQGLESVIVVYTAGADVDDIPPELKQVTIDLVTYYHKEQWRDSQSLMGASINNQTGTGNTNTPATSFPPHIQRILDLHK